MTSREHLSQGILELLLKNELAGEKIGPAALHLSYCIICREQRDELALKLAVHRMWETYQGTGSSDDSHIDDSTFRDFWRGELRDEEMIKQLSRHCVKCLECRLRRESVRARIEQEASQSQKSAFTTRTLLAVWIAWKRYPFFASASTALILAIVVALFLQNWHRGIPESPHNANSDELGLGSTGTARNNNSPQEIPFHGFPPNGSENKSTASRGYTTQRKEHRSNLIARARRIDLAQVPDGADSRSPHDADEGVKTYFRIVPSRSSPTRLHLGLPVNSKRGEYYISIRDPAFLAEIVLAKGKSSDGASLTVSIPMQDLKEDEYVLRIERHINKADNKEYIGDYPILVTRPASRSDSRAGEPTKAEK
jgi:hypothetical protein